MTESFETLESRRPSVRNSSWQLPPNHKQKDLSYALELGPEIDLVPAIGGGLRSKLEGDIKRS